MSSHSTVAVLGTGIMGSGIAQSLLRARYIVRVWNRTPDRATALADPGAIVAPDPTTALDGADAVLTMLYDADAVLDVMTEVADSGRPVPLWIQSSTIGLEGTARVARFATDRELSVIDAPVLGTKQPAEQGNLVVLASGDAELIERAQPIFDAIGSRTLIAGPDIGNASALKLACNSWVASLNAAVAQAIALTGGLGLDESLFLQAIAGGPTDSVYAHVKGEMMMASDFPPSFALDGALKDVRLIRSAAEAAGVNPRVLDALDGLYQHASDTGHGSEDMAAVITALRPQ